LMSVSTPGMGGIRPVVGLKLRFDTQWLHEWQTTLVTFT